MEKRVNKLWQPIKEFNIRYFLFVLLVQYAILHSNAFPLNFKCNVHTNTNIKLEMDPRSVIHKFDGIVMYISLFEFA